MRDEPHFEILEGTPRSGKTTLMIQKYALAVLFSDYTEHLVTAYSQTLARNLILEANGLGLKYILPEAKEVDHPKRGYYLQFKDDKGREKKIYFRGGGKKGDDKSIRGMTLGTALFTEIDFIDLEYIHEVFRRVTTNERWYIVGDLNPPSPYHPIIKEVFKKYGAEVHRFTPKDNPTMTERAMENLRKRLKNDSYLYRRDWLGERVMPEGVVYSVFDDTKHIVKDIGENEVIVDRFVSADGGQTDATSVTYNIVTYDNNEGKHKLYRVMNYYYKSGDGKPVKAMSTMAEESERMIGRAEDLYGMITEVYVDPACTSLSEEMRRVGLNTVNADNNRGDARGGAGSGIEVGIERVKNLMVEGQFYIIVNDLQGEYGMKDHLRELHNYIRDDRTGRPLDNNNDIMDEMRYAVNYFYKLYKVMEV